MLQTSKTKSAYSKKDKALCRPIFWYIVLSCYCVFGRDLLSSFELPNILFLVLRFGISAFLIVLACRYLNFKRILLLFGLEFWFGISYLITYVTNRYYEEEFLTYCITTLVICIPFLVLVSLVDDYACLYRYLHKASYVNTVLLLPYLFLTQSSITYSMPASYQLLFCTLLHINDVLRKDSKWKVLKCLLIGVEMVFIFVRGARGPLLCLAVFIALKMLTEFATSKRRIFFTVIGCVILVIAFANFDTVVSGIGVLLDKFGLYSRTYEQLISNKIFADSGRSSLQTHAIELIRENPFFGYGASADVKLLGGQYVHNILLELLFDFGIIIGSLIFLFITVNIVLTPFMRRSAEKEIRMLLLPLAYVMLFFSGTYLQSVYLFLFIGIMLQNSGRRRVQSSQGRYQHGK